MEGGYLREISENSGGRIVRGNVPTDLETFSFAYQSKQDTVDFDGDPDTENDYGPEYYGLVLMKVFQQAVVPPATEGEYEYIALVITPNWRGQTQ
ncbi:MAG: hypothetical protein L3K26_08740 [Candidatus Hydrogenedentes bacterium]|nr:hypothetical protein [Candidatus Hydrogenedentota bacterium]